MWPHQCTVECLRIIFFGGGQHSQKSDAVFFIGDGGSLRVRVSLYDLLIDFTRQWYCSGMGLQAPLWCAGKAYVFFWNLSFAGERQGLCGVGAPGSD